MVYVSEYSVTREYGGPEEGGWWFDKAQHVRMICICEDQQAASQISMSLNSAQNEIDESDPEYAGRYSVNGGADIVFYSEDSIGDHTLKEWPHYE